MSETSLRGALARLK
jgi:hypothetical protein